MAAAGITLTLAKERFDLYLKAETAVLAGQAHRFADGRELTRADLREIREGIAYWSGHVDRLDPSPAPVPRKQAVGRVRRGTYRIR